MRKLLLSALAFSVFGLSFGQVAQQNQLQVQTGPNNLKKVVMSNLSAQPKTLNTSLNLNDGEFTGHGLPGHNCASHDLTKEHYQERGVWQQVQADYQQSAGSIQPPASAKTPGTNTISIIFHVVYNNATENVSNAAIMNVYDDIVEDFQLMNANASNARPGFTPADANINFCLATQDPLGNPLAEPGVIRVSTTETFYDSDNGEENKMKSSATGGSDIWDRDDYLNVYICDITNGATSGTAGYAYRPTPSFLPGAAIDAIVLDYNLGVNNENILTHEIGHYLGLDHTWGGSGGCANDDGFADTPNTTGPSFNYAGSCSGSQQTCSGIETQYENYMDYSNCTVMFTQDQANYMLSILTGIRSSLLLSPGCDPTNTPPITDFTADVVTVPVGGAVNFTDLSTNAPTSWSWTFGGGAAASTLQNPAITFNTVGTYDVSLTATNAFGSDTETKTAYIQVVAPATGTTCDTLRNYDPSVTNYTYYNVTEGYLPGTGAINVGTVEPILEVAEHFFTAATAEVRRITVPIFILEDVSGTGSVNVNVYDGHDGTNYVPTGAPVATETVLFSDLQNLAFNEINFTTPGSVTGDFWVSFEMTYNPVWDTIVFGLNDTGPTTAVADSGFAVNINTIGWLSDDSAFDIPESINMDVMLSNGADPVANLQFSETEVCVGGSIDVNGSGSTNTTDYYWQFLNNTATVLIADTNVAATSFTLPAANDYVIALFTEGSCKSDLDFIVVTANPQVSATVTSTATTCGLNNGSITITNPQNGDGANYEYSLDGVNYVTTSTWNNLPSGNYDVYVRTTGDNCEVMYTTTIGASTQFTATTSPNQAICEGNSATISAAGGTTYSWTDGINPVGSTASITVTPATTTQYECLVTDGSGCQSIVTVTVTVNPLLDASFTFNDYCEGAANGPTNVATAGGVYSFNPAVSDGATISASTGVISNGVLNTTYTVEYATSGACPDTQTETVTVTGADDATFTTSDWCTNGTHSVTGIITPGGTFAFNPLPGDGAAISASTGEITGATAGSSYTIEYTTPASICQTSSTQTVTYNTAPTVNAGTDFSVCAGQQATLTATGASTYAWGGTVTNGVPFTPNGTATYTVTGTAANGCTDTDDIIVTVNTLPTVEAGVNQSECEGTMVTLTGSGTATTYTWNNGVTDNTPFTQANGTVTYTVTGTDANNCQNTDVVDVTITANPTVGAGSPQIVCEGQTVTLSGTGATTYTWDNGVTNNTAFTPSVGVTTYTVTGTTNGCSNTATVDVTVNALPAVTLPAIADVCANYAPITLSGGAPAGGTYGGANVTAGIFDPATATIGVNTVTYTFTDANNCSNTASETINVDDCADIHEDEIDALKVYPNPTADLLNIEFEGQFEVQLFDVNGKLVHVSNGSDKIIVDVASYEAGIYLIRLHANGQFYQKRIVRQ